MDTIVNKKLIPSPDERPDLYDAYDCRPPKAPDQKYLDAVTPQHVKDLLAQRAAAKK